MTNAESPGEKTPLALRVRTLKCPQCSRMTVYSTENLFRPFCSKNCQTGDLAAWATDEYKVAGSTVPQDAEQTIAGDNDDYESES